MVTLEEIAFNSLMPWSRQNSDEILFDELVAALDEASGYGSRLYFSMLSQIYHEMGFKLPPDLVKEWKKFARNPAVSPDGLYGALGAYGHPHTKVRFYARLTAYCAAAEIQNLEEEFQIHTSEACRLYEITRLAGRLERIITIDMQVKEHGEDDLLIIKILKAGALMAFLELIEKYGNIMQNWKPKLTPEGAYEQLAYTAMGSDALKSIVVRILKKYTRYFSNRKEDIANDNKNPKSNLTTSPWKKGDPDSIHPSFAHADNNDKGTPIKGRQGEKTTGSELIPDADTFISSGEVMHLLGITKSTLKRYRDNGTLRYMRPNPRGKIRYRRGDIDELMKQR